MNCVEFKFSVSLDDKSGNQTKSKKYVHFLNFFLKSVKIITLFFSK